MEPTMYTAFAKLTLIVAVFAVATGCTVEEPAPEPYHPQPTGGTANPPPPVPSPAIDAPRPLGAQGMLGYRVLADGSATLPAGDIGFLVTANGNGGYQIAWTDTAGSAAHFSGTLTTDGTFDASQTTHYSGYENVTVSPDLRTISFDSTPGSAVDGVATVSSTDPVYLDAYVDGVPTGFDIVFVGADSRQSISSSYNPVAFTSP
jgi:hypothetical protein